MAIAQQLYEGLPVGDEGNVGLITYMRTDSTHVAAVGHSRNQGIISARNTAKNTCRPTPASLPPRVKGAQEAHEAIRPTRSTASRR